MLGTDVANTVQGHRYPHKGLAKVETAFKQMKTEDLEIWPSITVWRIG